MAASAPRLGWTAAELFAVHPEHGTLRINCGVLMIADNCPLSIEATPPGFPKAFYQLDSSVR